MGAMDKRGLKTKPSRRTSKGHEKKRTLPYILKQPSNLSPEEAENERWANDSENPQIIKFREQYRTKTRKEAMIAALISTMGIITQACEMAGVGRQTHYDWLNDDPEYGKALEEAHSRKKDFYEHALIKLAKEGDSAAVRLANETINKDRGYIKRQEVVNSFAGTQNIKIVIPDNDIPDEPESQTQK